MKNKDQSEDIGKSPLDKIKVNLIKQMIENAERSIQTARELLVQVDPEYQVKKEDGSSDGQSRIVEGIFNGERMLALDGKTYTVPANYASKSKLVDGDKLKLTINADGSFIYKQIGPAERVRMMGNLISNDNDNFYVAANNDYFRVLKASVTYFKAKSGDEVTIIVPKGKKSGWAAIENIIVGRPPVLDSGLMKDSEELEDPDADDRPDAILEVDIDEDEADDAAPAEEEDKKLSRNNKSIIDEWVPDIEQMKKEAFSDAEKDSDEDSEN